jgi:hypothetical protein
MVHWPKSIGGNVMALMLALIVVVGVAQLAIALSSHPLVWAFAAALTTAALIVRHRRAAAAQDLALADAPSFGDVLPHWDRHDDLIPARF